MCRTEVVFVKTCRLLASLTNLSRDCEHEQRRELQVSLYTQSKALPERDLPPALDLLRGVQVVQSGLCPRSAVAVFEAKHKVAAGEEGEGTGPWQQATTVRLCAAVTGGRSTGRTGLPMRASRGRHVQVQVCARGC